MKKLLTLLLFTLAIVACSDNKAVVPMSTDYIEGVNYRVLSTPVETNSEQVQVMAFFWYGCPHCKSFEVPLLHWQQSLPDNIEVLQSPAIWSQAMALHAKVFFMVQDMPNHAEVHAALFTEIIALRAEADVEVQTKRLADFLQEYGLSHADFTAQLVSPDLDNKLQQAIDIMQQSTMEGTPAVLVNGRYLVLNKSADSFEQVLDIANFLIVKEQNRLAAQAH
ncbi:thiol:disulfide interchange protein DsbA/DsbL [Shewanella youngdeokensis]|uniref:Thiol:disulfide interchange protein n=1 Tax=Shewanella youngdeokensis TaxID=2999068 RepID=A0ABZ0K0F8_9GAMM|nr:thiol:disulfide interchange protein DsbA/DsbL [Shewanella sp. DAU334]